MLEAASSPPIGARVKHLCLLRAVTLPSAFTYHRRDSSALPEAIWMILDLQQEGSFWISSNTENGKTFHMSKPFSEKKKILLKHLGQDLYIINSNQNNIWHHI